MKLIMLFVLIRLFNSRIVIEQFVFGTLYDGHMTVFHSWFPIVFSAQFSLGFGIDVHELLVVKSLDEIAQLGLKCCDFMCLTTSTLPVVYVVLAQFFINIENHSAVYIMDLCQEQFRFRKFLSVFVFVWFLFRIAFFTSHLKIAPDK